MNSAPATITTALRQPPVEGERRTAEQLRKHYEIEKALADKLRRASREERTSLYSSVYDELYRRVPDHPQLTRKSSPEATVAAVSSQMKFLKPYLDESSTFLEVGPGDCSLSIEAAQFFKAVYAADVSSEITRRADAPENFKLILTNGSNIPLPPDSVHVAYSNQLMEHLHPDDALEQLQSIYHLLVSGGVYLCTTPNRLGGPWDISRYFDAVATGFHLKEYTCAELSQMFRTVGFRNIVACIGLRGRYLRVPAGLFSAIERILSVLPSRRVVSMFPFRLLLDLRLVGTK